jgi:hypothetical protein
MVGTRAYTVLDTGPQTCGPVSAGFVHVARASPATMDVLANTILLLRHTIHRVKTSMPLCTRIDL